MIRLFFPLALLILGAPASAEPWLSDEGKAMRSAHQFLFGEFRQQHESEISDDGILRRVKLRDSGFQADGSAELELPAGTEQVLQFMRYLELHGTGLESLGGVRLLPLAPDSNLPVSTQTPKIYRVKTVALPAPGQDTPRFKLGVQGKATITRIDLIPFAGGIRQEFDRSPYSNLAHEFPPEKLAIDLDLDHELSIDGHVWLEREKWFRYYNRPGSLPRTMEDYAVDRGFLPGRQMLKFAPALERGYRKQDPKLKEDPARPGYPDPGFFEVHRGTLFADLEARGYAPDMKFAMCFNDYPSFMSRHPNGRGTPRADKFDAAAELVSRYLQNEIRHSGRTATWWELKNESSIKAEWDFHWLKEYDSWKLLADFHNTVAGRVHREVPGVQIAGPASAWMQVQVGDFKLWKSQARFMDLTRDHLDAYSHHFYEDANTLAAYDRRQFGYSNYLLGRLDAVLDLFRAHMVATDNLKPMLITECGALNIGASDADYWLRLRTYSAFLTQFMQRPEQIDLVVPFIFLHAPWDPTNAHSAYVPDGEGGFKETPCARFFDLWQNFYGRRLPVSSPNKYVRCVAVHDGEVVRIAISNLTNRRQEIDLGKSLPARQRRLYRLDGKIRYEAGNEVDPAAIPVEVGETTIVTLTLPQKLTPRGTVLRRDYFSDKIVTREREFTIAAPTGARAARLFVGLQNRGGLDAPLRGTINGHRFGHSTKWAQGVEDFFEHAIIELPPEHLEAENQIVIENLSESTTISEVHLEIDSIQE